MGTRGRDSSSSSNRRENSADKSLSSSPFPPFMSTTKRAAAAAAVCPVRSTAACLPHTDDAEDEEREKEEEVEKGVGVAAGRRKAAAEGKVQATPRYAIAIRNTGRGTTGFCDPRANNILRYCMLADLKL